jgi:D-beta-D-heptose 7-phosphate kinase/D-beta-D-heptose 1-phosphate adenosyltransferase
MSDAPKQRVALVVGDLMLDRRLAGRVTKISPEAPVPVIQLERGGWSTPGGAANVAANIASLGQLAVLVGVVGDDPNGENLAMLLDDMSGVWPFLIPVPGAMTTTKSRLVSGGQQVYRLDEERPLPQVDLLGAIQRAARTIEDDGYVLGIVVISDYDKGLIVPEAYLYLHDLARVRGIPIYVDAKPRQLPMYRGASLITPNLDEASAAALACVHPALAMETDAVSRAAVAGSWLLQQHGYQDVVVTCGGEGAVLIHQGTHQHFPTQAHHVYDVAGAGDTFLAAMAVGHLLGHDLDAAVRCANVAAGLAVQVPGIVAVREDAWLDEQLRLSLPYGKCMGREAIVSFAERRRRAGDRVVFANGVFDLLHPGHIWLLQQAKDQGETLIVAINSDESVRRIKGPERPLTPATMRLMCLCLNSLVDAVTTFDEDTPEALIHELKPHVLVKGQEHREQAVPGADFVARRGGRVLFVPPYEGFSTTKIKERLDAGEQL